MLPLQTVVRGPLRPASRQEEEHKTLRGGQRHHQQEEVSLPESLLAPSLEHFYRKI